MGRGRGSRGCTRMMGWKSIERGWGRVVGDRVSPPRWISGVVRLLQTKIPSCMIERGARYQLNIQYQS